MTDRRRRLAVIALAIATAVGMPVGLPVAPAHAAMADAVPTRVSPAHASPAAATSPAAAAGDDSGTSTTIATDGTAIADNPFIPEGQDLSSCISSLPRPDCGSRAQGGTIQLVTFGVLMAGMAFIGWRIVRGVRRRERSRAAS